MTDTQERFIPVLPGWPRRHWRLCAIACALVLAAALVYWSPWQASPRPPLCGAGLTAVGSPYTCVGLDLDSSALSGSDSAALRSLEKRVKKLDAAITTASFDTIVLLEDLTPNPAVDGLSASSNTDSIEGAITAVDAENDGNKRQNIPRRYKLLLANFGSQAGSWKQAVGAIETAQRSWHISAVTGLGQSLTGTRYAEAGLSGHNILTIGGEATGDDMNIDPATRTQIPTYLRVGPTNSAEADAAAGFINSRLPHKHIMIISDKNPNDDYATTLRSEFLKHYRPQRQLYFSSAADGPDTANRAQTLKGWVQEVTGTICEDNPDLIYFAGRGTDLGAFLADFAADGGCTRKIPIVSGDDASSVTETPAGFTIYFTALAYPGQWSKLPPTASGKRNLSGGYQAFISAFTNDGFQKRDLDDGNAMIVYDATHTALIASFDAETNNSGSSAYMNPGSLVNQIAGMCQNPVSGATGLIAFDQSGNAAHKAIPVLHLSANTTSLADLEWTPDGPPKASSLC